MIWRCSWQDYRGWPRWHKQPHPAIQSQDFDTKEEAEAHAVYRRKRGMTACVAIAPAPRRRERRAPLPGAEAFNQTWKLTS
jgi:hypothetical protein